MVTEGCGGLSCSKDSSTSFARTILVAEKRAAPAECMQLFGFSFFMQEEFLYCKHK